MESSMPNGPDALVAVEVRNVTGDGKTTGSSFGLKGAM